MRKRLLRLPCQQLRQIHKSVLPQTFQQPYPKISQPLQIKEEVSPGTINLNPTLPLSGLTIFLPIRGSKMYIKVVQ